MSTRGACGLRKNNKDKVTYNHRDSYPEGLGDSMVHFIRTFTTGQIGAAFDAITLINEDVPPTAEQVDLCLKRKAANLTVSKQSTADWYCLLRGEQGRPDTWISGSQFMADNHEFLDDSLMCEWAYIVNLDEETLEVYKGFNHDKGAPGRYAGLAKRDGYGGVALLNSTPLASLRAMDDATVKSWISGLEGHGADE